MNDEINMVENNAEVDEEVDQVLHDFVIKQYAGPEEIQHEWEGAPPLYYYDNDDGFWDSYKRYKQDRWEQNSMITKRPFFKH